MKQNYAAGAERLMARRSRVSRRLKRTLHDRGYGTRGNRSLLQRLETRATKQVLPGRHRRVNTQANGNYYTHDEEGLRLRRIRRLERHNN